MKLLNTMDFPTWEIKLIVFPKSPSGPSPRPAYTAPLCETVWLAQPSSEAQGCQHLTATWWDPHVAIKRWLTLCHQACYCRTPGLYAGDVIIFPSWQLKLFKGQQCHFFIAEIKVKNMTSWEQCAFCVWTARHFQPEMAVSCMIKILTETPRVLKLLSSFLGSEASFKTKI